MDESTVATLQALRPHIVGRWQAALRSQPVSSPLAEPATLFYLMDWTLDEVFRFLRHPTPPRPFDNLTSYKQICRCGLNPLLAYFECLDAVLLGTAAQLYAASNGDANGQAGQPAVEFHQAVQFVASREIEAFCAVCQLQSQPFPGCVTPKLN